MFKNIMATFGILVTVVIAFFIGIGMSYDDAPQRMNVCSTAFVKSMNGEEMPEPETVTETCYSFIRDPKTGQEIKDESSVTKTEMSFAAYQAKFDK